MNRVHNFSAGPSMLPLEVLQQVQQDLICYKDSGMSVMEMSHRSKEFEVIIQTAEQDLRDLMQIPQNYKILFLQGGGSTQFAMIPFNLLHRNKKADYILTGQWAKKAYQEAQRYGDIQILASSEDSTYNYIPTVSPSDIRADADYVYITLNNTIYGTRYTEDTIPFTGDIPLVADISSNILAENIDISKFGLVFAGAQKNLGPAGVTVVIIREELIGHAMETTPTMLNYQTFSSSNSLYNTPPTFAIYVMGLVFQWAKKQGGVTALQQINQEKASILYQFLDQSSMFKGTVVPQHRSLMNIPFVLPTPELNNLFLKQAQERGFVNLKGHRSVGGMRASIYNAMTKDSIIQLVQLMKEFEQHHTLN